ncbi:MAG TPA: hypothetical protein PK760_02150 [Flavobacteriales bacterium]|nr:hypothetical protein [Flavobacteriales bacterium]
MQVIHRISSRSRKDGIRFDPWPFVHLVLTQFPEEHDVARAFARCTRAWPHNDHYTSFAGAANIEPARMITGTIHLRHPMLGSLKVNLVHDAQAPSGIRICSMEHQERLLGESSGVVCRMHP